MQIVTHIVSEKRVDVRKPDLNVPAKRASQNTLNTEIIQQTTETM